ncbi:MAG: ethanolamine ammonia-lyase reactivating factor EutA [Lachnospiraceae bacterium]|nr:ethanolamine ammonia-lyase reactivating factor EutA [Lachnospiraceae bacterium]
MEYIISVGIDIGTSTTQMIVSKLGIENVTGFGSVPRMEIVSKQILYRSGIHFTPLRKSLEDNRMEEIDGEKVADILKKEYKKAGIMPSDVGAGAVIITGESSRKRNARKLVEDVSRVCGDFVVSVAGPDLESVLAAKGAGADRLSAETGLRVMNLDIGGGTTNIAVFDQGKLVDTACLDLGGRLIRVDKEQKITYISSRVEPYLPETGEISIGQILTTDHAKAITKCMTSYLAESIGLVLPSKDLEKIYTNHGLQDKKRPDIILCSGGVADCMIHSELSDFAYGDLGVLLGRSLFDSGICTKQYLYDTRETMRATVIGAGNFTMEVSGSTIQYQNCNFPFKNIPVLRIVLEGQEDILNLSQRITRQVKEFWQDGLEQRLFALSMSGLSCPNFREIEETADEIRHAIKELSYEGPIILVLETDMAKALGQALRRRFGHERSFLCMDGISSQTGDFIDIGEPIGQGSAVPIVVKTLIFNS